MRLRRSVEALPSARGRWPAALGAALLALAACGGTGGGQTASPIVVCVDAALSGPFVQLGQYDVVGVKAYFNTINRRGGLLGRKVNVAVENDQSSPPLAATLARKCVTQDHANFILGPEETSSSAAAVPVADALQTVMIGMQSGWNMQGLTQPQLHSYAFPGYYNVFYQNDLDTVLKLIVPRHYTRIAVIQDATSGGLPNEGYMRTLGKQYGFEVVAVQNTQPGQTNDTPQVLALLAARPQIIVLGMTPGPDTTTAIRAIRSQDPDIPISECSGCWLPSFIAATGGPAIMRNVYLLGSIQELVASLPDTPENRSTIQDAKAYLAAMKASGYTSPDEINSALIGWAASEELTQAIRTARSTAETAVRNALQHQKLDTVGIFWSRTPQDYAHITRVQDVMAVVAPDGNLQVYQAG
ncbi:MAG TPA: ABC transporter substrate-binding protein [Candidatus Dormibacteraeota bacterium]|nr:ABC transporter substrate-binding protein [Candidatus Dormibacteraeota bacterium]